MTPTQYQIISFLSLLFGEKVVEEQFNHLNFLNPGPKSKDEVTVCQLDEDEKFFLQMVPTSENKELKLQHFTLLETVFIVCLDFIRSRHNLIKEDLLGLRQGWILVKPKNFAMSRLDEILKPIISKETEFIN